MSLGGCGGKRQLAGQPQTPVESASPGRDHRCRVEVIGEPCDPAAVDLENVTPAHLVCERVTREAAALTTLGERTAVCRNHRIDLELVILTMVPKQPEKATHVLRAAVDAEVRNLARPDQLPLDPRIEHCDQRIDISPSECLVQLPGHLQTALPEMARDLGTTPTNLQWVISGYLLSLASVFIVGGRLADVFGRRRFLLAGAVMFGFTSLLGGAASVAWLVIVMRLLQGVGGALLFPVGLAVVTNAYPPERVQRAIVTVFGIAAVGQALGPLLGGGSPVR
jgi:Major Facilitator Superfamily